MCICVFMCVYDKVGWEGKEKVREREREYVFVMCACMNLEVI